MQEVLVVYNPAKEPARKEAERLKQWLCEKKARVRILPSTVRTFPKADFCVSLGGDGTILKIAKTLACSSIPVLGVNLGSLGFLAGTDARGARDLIQKALAGKLKINERILLEVRVGGKNFLAVNDCVVRSGVSARVILLGVRVNGEFFADYLGDGLIVSTPTGSTAYSLAAGGPIVQPLVPIFIVSPICPHTLSQRPVILSSDSLIEITAPEYKSNRDIVLSVDGQDNIEISAPSKITISKSKFRLKLLSNPEISYFSILRSKLNWGITNAARTND